MCYIINQSFNIFTIFFPTTQEAVSWINPPIWKRKRDVFKVMLKTGKHKTKTNYMFRSQENQSTNSAFKNQIHLQRVYRDLVVSVHHQEVPVKI